jgi:hypothetical protein
MLPIFAGKVGRAIRVGTAGHLPALPWAGEEVTGAGSEAAVSAL